MIEAGPSDWMLFDGQQRLAGILLGFEDGPHAQFRRLHIDVKATDQPELLITSAMQPFGYQSTSQNQRLPIRAFEERWSLYRKNHGLADSRPYDPQEVFRSNTSEPLLLDDTGRSFAPLLQVISNPLKFGHVGKLYKRPQSST